MNQKNRRMQERFSLQLKAKLTTHEESSGKKLSKETIAANISSGGAFITTDLDLPLASKVYLEFLLDYEELKKLRFILSASGLKAISKKKTWVKATGIVIRIEKNGLAVIFDKDYQLSPMEIQDKE